MRLQRFVVPGLLVAGVLFTLGTLEQAMGLFVQTFGSGGAVMVGGEASATPLPARVLTAAESPRGARASAVRPVATVSPASRETPAPEPEDTATASPTAALTETATPSAAAVSTVGATNTPATAATPTLQVAATSTAKATRTPEPSATMALASTAVATATVGVSSTPVAKATVSPCPVLDGVRLLQPADQRAAIGDAGIARIRLVNDGAADIAEGGLLRLIGPHGAALGDGVQLSVGDKGLDFDATLGAWSLPALAAGEAEELTVTFEPGVVPASNAELAVATREEVVVGEIGVRCAGEVVVVSRQKVVLRFEAVEGETAKPVGTGGAVPGAVEKDAR